MQKNKIIRFVQSLIILPIATMSMPVANQSPIDITQIPQTVFMQKENINTLGFMAYNRAMDSKELTLKARAQAIDTYFEGLPLAGHGLGMVEAAEKYGLDWRLLPAIAMRETTGGKYACPKTHKRTGDIRYTYNVYGWGSCKITFESYEAGFEILARNLSGNNPNTATHYADKTVPEILVKYNPVHIAPKYVPQVMKIMDDIGERDLDASLALNS